MVEGGVAREQGLAQQQLPHYAANAPDISAFFVGLRPQENLGGSVPAGGDFLSEHNVLLRAISGKTPGQAEIANLQMAIGIDEYVAGLEVPVDDLSRVQILHPLEDLVHDKAVV